MSRPEHRHSTGRFARDLRRRLTPAEARLWMEIRGGQTGARFRRQVPVGRWVVDFASLDPRVVVEIDDNSHTRRVETARTRIIEDLGFTILRYWNQEVQFDLNGVVRDIEETVRRLGRTADPG